jgi:hypothetical protein
VLAFVALSARSPSIARAEEPEPVGEVLRELYCSTRVARQSTGGPLISSPHVVFVWWGAPFWENGQGKGEHDFILQAWRDPLFNFLFFSRLNEYGMLPPPVGASTSDLALFGPSAFCGTPLSSMVNEGDVSSLLSFNFTFNSQLPQPTSDTLYIVMLPPGCSDTYDTSQGFGGHHQHVTYQGNNVWYAVIEYTSDQTYVMDLITHEVMEAATNPDGSSGYWDTAQRKEIGDLCPNTNIYLNGYPSSKYWSQEECSCQ